MSKGATTGKVRVTLVGAGNAGRSLARIAASSDDFEIVAACSRNPDHVGRGLAELAGREAVLPVVVGDLEQALAVDSDVLVVATASRLAEVGPALRAGIESGRNVIATAEEASFPWAMDEALADELDARARELGVTVLGTGVNPGFAFDALVVTVCGAAWDVASLEVERVLDVAGYSAPILRGLGIGFDAAEFERGCADGTISGHIGFPQSMRVVARALGRRIERIDREITPLFTETPLSVQGIEIGPGESAGFTQHYVGIADGGPWFTAHLVAHTDPAGAGLATRDLIEVSGSVPVRMELKPAVNSQKTVAALLANSLRRVVEGPPGWLTVADLPPARPVGRRRPQPSPAKEDPR